MSTDNYTPTDRALTPPRRTWAERLFNLPSGATNYASATRGTELVTIPARNRETPSGGGGIIAAARKLTGTDVKNKNADTIASAGNVAPWQEEAWEMLDVVGEQQYLVSTLASQLSRADLYVGISTAEGDPGSMPDHSDDVVLHDLLDAIGDGPLGLSQILERAAMNLLVAGEGWLVGLPPRLVPGTEEYSREQERLNNPFANLVDREEDPDTTDGDDVMSLIWRFLSVSEVSIDQAGMVNIRMEGGEGVTANPDQLYLIRVWKPHARRAWEATSPIRASLPVLRELMGLTMHVSAQIDSRLAGAGLLVVPTSASAALKRASGMEENDPRDPLMEAMQEAMQTPIHDRASASAIVPLTVTVPGEDADKIRHISFASTLDTEARELRDESIRRLALGQNAPPELLLGTSDSNHWGAWLVREETVRTHLSPLLRLICDALTTQYLRPLMISLGYSEDEANDHVVWFEVEHLISRPNRTQDGKDAHSAGTISDEALRNVLGFDDDDAPGKNEGSTRDLAVQKAFDMVTRSPGLAQTPGLPALVDQIIGIMSGDTATPTTAPAPTTDTSDTSSTDRDPIPNEGTA